MYSSLDRIDIVARKKDTGRHEYILTDHRSAQEVESEPELSVLFALTRVAAAARMGAGEGGCDVTYVSAAEPPALLHEAIVAAGGRLSVDGRQAATALDQPPRAMADLAEAAFSGLAQRLARQAKGAVDETFLGALEDEILAATPGKDDDELAYWSRILELSAVCGEVLRARVGGRWEVPADRDGGLFPFAFTAGSGTFNVVDKAQRFLDRGESQRPSQLLRMAEDVGRGEDGPLMLNLKEPGFPRDHGICRDLLAGGGEGVPLVFLGRDHPNTFAYVPAGTPDADVQFEEARANLARLEIPTAEHVVGETKMIVASDHFYAAEKILDKAFLEKQHRRLGAKLLAAAVPHKGLLLVTAEVAPPGIAVFAALAKALHAQPKGAPALSPVVFLVSEGEVVGCVREEKADVRAAGSSQPAPTKTKPRLARREPSRWSLFSRLFKGH